MKNRTPVALSVIVAGLMLIAGWVQLREPVRTTFQPESKLQLDGTSSVHDWTCNATQLTGFVESDVSDGLNVSKVEVTIPVESIDCGHKAMNGRLASTMKVKEHPNVVYKLTDAKVVANPSPDTYKLQANGSLTIAGVEKPVSMIVDAKRLADGRFQFSGSVPVLTTDFGMKPVVFLAIKTGDEVKVSFDVISAP